MRRWMCASRVGDAPAAFAGLDNKVRLGPGPYVNGGLVYRKPQKYLHFPGGLRDALEEVRVNNSADDQQRDKRGDGHCKDSGLRRRALSERGDGGAVRGGGRDRHGAYQTPPRAKVPNPCPVLPQR
jgi:hypothetical protein